MIDGYIYKQTAIDAVHKSILDFFDICDDDEESPMTYKDERLLEINKAITTQIKAVPSEDVVEVVRCKDCRLSEPGIGITEYWCCYWDNKTLENGYCSYGERRGSEQNDVSDTNVGNIMTADGTIRGVKDFFKDYNGCRNCKHQPQPMQMCDYGKQRTYVELICSGWERKDDDTDG